MLDYAVCHGKRPCTLFSKGLSILLIYRVLCCTLFYHLYFKQTFFFLPAFWRTGVFGFLVYSFNLHQRDKRI